MKRIPIEGKRFGRLRVLKYLGREKYTCICSCGKNSEVWGHSLRKKNGTRSCGCLRDKLCGDRFRTHGVTHSKPHYIWGSVIQRCRNRNHKSYPAYGGRGIGVCKRWEKFENFLEDMGSPPKGKQLDRIDNTKGYSKNNCRWASPLENSNNKRNSVFITFQGRTLTQAQWGRKLRIAPSLICARLKRGRTVEQALSTSEPR